MMKKTLKMRDLAYNFIKNKILINEFSSGEYLEEKRLCEMIGVSRTPIREAVNQLETENFIETIPNKGSFVTSLDVKKIKELFQTRYYLEPIVLELSWKKIDKSVFLGYKNGFQSAIAANDIPELNELDYEFHNYINSCCGNDYLINIMDGLQDQFQRIRTLGFYSQERVIGGAEEHIGIIDFFLAGQQEECVAFFKQHILNTERYYFLSIES